MRPVLPDSRRMSCRRRATQSALLQASVRLRTGPTHTCLAAPSRMRSAWPLASTACSSCLALCASRPQSSAVLAGGCRTTPQTEPVGQQAGAAGDRRNCAAQVSEVGFMGEPDVGPTEASGRGRPIPAYRSAPKLPDARPGPPALGIYEAVVHGLRQSAMNRHEHGACRIRLRRHPVPCMTSPRSSRGISSFQRNRNAESV